MPFVILPTNSISGGYDITNSLRFNPSSSDNLTRTPASAGNRKTWTFSAWVKKSANASQTCVFSAGSDPSSNLDIIAIWDTVDVYSYSGAYAYRLTSTALFRDPSAWYHLVVALDTTQATNTNRLKLYINGTQLTDFTTTTYPTQNADSYHFNNTSVHHLGRKINEHYWNGYMSDVYFIDGQQLTPSSFGETDEDTGIWKPKAFSGTYGTNGFYLQFKNSASLGTDSSGNGNTFTVNNLTSVDQSTDTPTNNFATMNPLDNKSGGTYSDGNLRLTDGSNDVATRSTIAVDKGKWYWESQWTYSSGSGSQAIYLGILDTVAQIDTGGNAQTNTALFSVIYNPNGGGLYKNGTSVGSSYAGSVNSIFGFKLDLDNGDLYIHQNGTYYNSGNAVVTGITSGKTYSPYFSPNAGATDSMATANFGNPPYAGGSNTDGAGFGNFSYAVPSGYYSLCTKNLATFG
jgi:hypothetical protein